MIAALEQETIAVREQRPNPSPQRAGPISRSQGVNGARRNHSAAFAPQIIVALERDHWDMARLVSGDEQALDSLMQRHAKRLFAHLERIVKNRADAAELVQETFIRVFQHRLEYDFQSRFTAWLYVIGSHLAINLLRWRSRRPECVPLPDSPEDQPDSPANALVNPAPTPREQAESDEWTDALEEALARLPEQLRVPLLLVSLDSRSQAEVAARLGCTVKAVETRLYHGRKRLRAELESILNPWQCRLNGAIHSQRS
jgi:RNA polymerase sigma-70 factor (ECF subfamily)